MADTAGWPYDEHVDIVIDVPWPVTAALLSVGGLLALAAGELTARTLRRLGASRRRPLTLTACRCAVLGFVALWAVGLTVM